MAKRLPAVILSSLALLVSACAGHRAGGIIDDDAGRAEKHEIPALLVSSPQEAVYDGHPHPLLYTYTGGAAPEIIYYPSEDARENNRNGSSGPPANAGIYYVRASSPEEDVYAEIRILKCPVKLEAAAFQEAFYNGDPKRVEAATVPPVSLSYSYYPNPELRETAIKAAEEAARVNQMTRYMTETFRGYKRVERAPIEEGTYYVWIFFPGDENHLAASAEVEFTILPPLHLRSRE